MDNLRKQADMPERICSLEGCESPHQARGFCQKHYTQARKAGLPDTDKTAQHILTGVDMDALTATCQVCGPDAPVQIIAGGPRCRTKYQAMRRERRARFARTEKLNAYHRDYNRRAKYRLGPGGLESLLEASGSGCQICLTPLTLKTMRIDHDHDCCTPGAPTCGECIRGILCNSCNTGLGLLGDSLDRLMRAADYLSHKTAA